MNNDQKTVETALLPLQNVSAFIQEIIDEHRAFANTSHSLKVNPEMQAVKLSRVAHTQASMDAIQQEIHTLHLLVTTDALEHNPLSSVEKNFSEKVQGLRLDLKKLVNI
jgi:hypothetical protein